MNKKIKNKINEAGHQALAQFKIAGMIYKEFKLLARMKKVPLLVLSLPFLFLIVYSAGSQALSNPQSLITAGVCINDPLAEEMINSIQGNFRITKLNQTDCINNLITNVKNGKFLIGFVIPAGFINSVSNAKQGVINYYVDDSKPITASMTGYFLENGFSAYSTELVKNTEEELKIMASTARTKINSVSSLLNTTSAIIDQNQALFSIAYPLLNNYVKNALNELSVYDKEIGFVQNLSVQFLTKPVLFSREQVYTGVNNTSFNFSAVYAIISLFTLLLLASSSIIFDKKSNYLLRIKATRTFTTSYLISKLTLYIVLSLAQLLLVMGLMSLQGAIFNFSLDSLLASFAVITILNTSIGLLIGSISESENVAILSSLMLSLPFLFLSGVFFPVEFMPNYIQAIANIVPLHKEVSLLKQAAVMNASLAMIESVLTNLLLTSAILLGITYAVIKFKD